MRRQTLSNLGTYLQQLESALQARGSQVLWARTSAEACQFIVDLARRSGVGPVLQTQSALPLEIGLAAALQGAGFTLSPTNQGEFLAALSGQRPTHPNAGAAHLRIDDMVRTLHARLDMPVLLTADAASHVIRGRVRQAALQSGLAVMGIDLAVAETGTMALFNDINQSGMTHVPYRGGAPSIAVTVPPAGVSTVMVNFGRSTVAGSPVVLAS